MRRWLARILLFLVLAPITASASTSPSVLTATIGSDGRSITRFTLRFSEPMVPLGKGPSPIDMKCKVDGLGRWVDPATYVWEFEQPLPGGITCTADLKTGLETLSGLAVTGTRSFPIDSGGPFPRAISPRYGDIEEDQSFFVAVNGPIDRASIAANA